MAGEKVSNRDPSEVYTGQIGEMASGLPEAQAEAVRNYGRLYLECRDDLEGGEKIGKAYVGLITAGVPTDVVYKIHLIDTLFG